MLEEIHELIYSAVMTATIVHNKNKNSNNQPTENKIKIQNHHRKDV